MKLRIRAIIAVASARAAALALALAAAPAVAAPDAADLVVTDAMIYTAAGPTLAQALAVRHGKLLYVGDAQGAAAYVGPRTEVRHAGGRLIVPGLVDAHIHPIDIVDLDVCDLDSAAKSLRELSVFVKACIERYHPAPGRWLRVHQWSP